MGRSATLVLLVHFVPFHVATMTRSGKSLSVVEPPVAVQLVADVQLTASNSFPLALPPGLGDFSSTHFLPFHSSLRVSMGVDSGVENWPVTDPAAMQSAPAQETPDSAAFPGG